MNYKIFQMDPRNPLALGRKYFDLTEDTLNLEEDFYKEVYSGTIEDKENPYELLENLFEIFNLNHPKDFKGHSLSVSDVVQLGDTYYHCQGLGWKAITLTNEKKQSNRGLFIFGKEVKFNK